MFQGVFTALVTPMTQRGDVDFQALEKLVEDQIRAGVDGLVPMGTTGESPTLDYDEHIKVVTEVVRISAGRISIVAGTGSNSTEEAVMLTKRAKDAGADATLQVVPYYNKPNQEGIYRHFMAVMDEAELPTIVYNIVGRTGRNLETDTLMRLAEHPLCVGVKEASGDLGQMMEVLARRPQGFSVLSGDDNLFYPLLALGGDGVISVVSHLIPGEMKKIFSAVRAGDYSAARSLHYQYLDLMKMIFIDVNPLPVKTALALQGRIQEVFRLPLCPMDSGRRAALEKTLKTYGLIG